MGQIVLHKQPHTVATRNASRSKTSLVEQDTITIHWMNINEKYAGQGLATVLMSYGICKMKLLYNDIRFVFLEDMSDKSKKSHNNIYNLFGATFIDDVKFSDIGGKGAVDFATTYKQIKLDHDFIFRVDQLLSKLEAKGGRKRRKYQKK